MVVLYILSGFLGVFLFIVWKFFFSFIPPSLQTETDFFKVPIFYISNFAMYGFSLMFITRIYHKCQDAKLPGFKSLLCQFLI